MRTHSAIAHLPRGENPIWDAMREIYDAAAEHERDRLTFDVLHERACAMRAAGNAVARGLGSYRLSAAEARALSPGRNVIESRMSAAEVAAPPPEAVSVYRTRRGTPYLFIRRPEAERQYFDARHEQASREQARENGRSLMRAFATAKGAAAPARVFFDQTRPGLMPDRAVRPGLDPTQPGLNAGGSVIDVSGLPGRNTTEQAIYYLRGRLPGFSEQQWEEQIRIAGEWVAAGKLVGQQAYATTPLGLPPGAIKPGGLPAGAIGGTPAKAGAIVR